MMSREVVTVRPSDTVATARARLRGNQILHLLVLEDGEVVGVVAYRDLAGKPEGMPVEELMARDVTAIDADATLRRAASLMVRCTSGCLPVLDGGKLAGVITTSDLMKVLNADMTLS